MGKHKKDLIEEYLRKIVRKYVPREVQNEMLVSIIPAILAAEGKVKIVKRCGEFFFFSNNKSIRKWAEMIAREDEEVYSYIR